MPAIVDGTRLTKITVDELREACQANPDHYIVPAYRQAIHSRKPGGQMVSVGTRDLQALRENKRVVMVTEIRQEEGGEPLHVVYKELTDLPPGCTAHKYVTRRPGDQEVPPPEPVEEPITEE